MISFVSSFIIVFLQSKNIDKFFKSIESEYPNLKIVLNKTKVINLVLNKNGEKEYE